MSIRIKPSRKLIYLDHAATTPVRGEVLRAMKPFWGEKFGNPSSLYKLAVEAKMAVENARKSIASILNARSEEIVFTGGGSESVSLGILGVARGWCEDNNSSSSSYFNRVDKHHGHIITSEIEHHAVLRAVEQLQREGFLVTKIKVDKQGFFDLEHFKKSIRPDTILVSLMYANNEVGTIEPIRQIGKIIREENLKRSQISLSSSGGPPSRRVTKQSQGNSMGLPRRSEAVAPRNDRVTGSILFHTDACQAAGFLDLNVQRLGVDLMSINASKIYGPKQVGALFVNKGVKLEPLIFGGGQERGLRSGTENVPGVVGFAKALELVVAEREKENERLEKLRDYLIREILKRVTGARLNGHAIVEPPPAPTKVGPPSPRGRGEDNRLPHNINISFKDCEGEALMLYLDAYDVAVSTGSACTSGETEASHVLRAIGLSERDAKSSLRFSLGKSTTKQELDFVLKVLPHVVEMARKAESL